MDVGYHYPSPRIRRGEPEREPTKPEPDQQQQPYITTPPEWWLVITRAGSPKRCRASECPIKQPHATHEYWDQGLQPHRQDWEIFNGSNPPEHVWNAYHRLQGGKATTMEDLDSVHQFRRINGYRKNR